MRYRDRYNVLVRRRAAWRKELTAEKSKYSKKVIRSAIAAISADIVACLKERTP